MTTTTETGQRFTLDEAKAREWITTDPHGPEITELYRAGSGDYAGETALLIQWALGAGIISDPLYRDQATLAWEFIPCGDMTDPAYRWVLYSEVSDEAEGHIITATAIEGMWALGQLAGIESALCVLREAVTYGNALVDDLARYVASLPLAARAQKADEVWVAHMSHRHGDDYTVHVSYELAKAEIAGYAREWWHELDHEGRSLPESCDDLSDDEVIQGYFENDPYEDWHIEASAVITS